MLNLPSPVQQITFREHKFYLKRDDLIDPFISGNKWRKLKYTLKQANAAQKTHLVTFGGAYSNHLLATAAAAARFGLQASAFVRGEEVNNPTLTLCKLYGMQLYFVDRCSYRDKEKLFEQFFKNDPNAYFVDEGGAGEEGIIGCAEIIDELEENYQHIFCAAGTGTTAAGLLRGIQRQNLNTKLHVVPVLKGAEFIAHNILKTTSDSSHLVMEYDYHFGGYAKTTPSLIRFIQQFCSETGVLIDPIYTGKLFYAVVDWLAHNKAEEDQKILVIHSGGLHGILGKLDEFWKEST